MGLSAEERDAVVAIRTGHFTFDRADRKIDYRREEIDKLYASVSNLTSLFLYRTIFSTSNRMKT